MRVEEVNGWDSVCSAQLPDGDGAFGLDVADAGVLEEVTAEGVARLRHRFVTCISHTVSHWPDT